jgi:hypothetical protein
MLKRLSGRLRQVSTGPLALAALIVFLLFTALVLPRQSRSAEAVSGGAGSPDTSIFYTAGDLYRMAEAYGPEGRAAYVWARFTFDVIFPLVYTLFLVTAISWLFARAFPPDSRWQRANLVPLLAALFDLLENVSTSLVMARYPAQTPAAAVLAPIFTAAKWLFVTGSFVLLLVGAVATARRRILAACVLVALLAGVLLPGQSVSAMTHPFPPEQAADVAALAVVTVTNTTDVVDGETTTSPPWRQPGAG